MTVNRRSYDEKRGFIRVPIECEVRLQRAADGSRFSGAGKNLSASGVLFHTDEPLQPGDQLEIRIEAAHTLHSVLDASIEVVRVEARAGEGQSFAVGSAIRSIREQ